MVVVIHRGAIPPQRRFFFVILGGGISTFRGLQVEGFTLFFSI